MLLSKRNLFIFLFIVSAIVSEVSCQSTNDTEITTESLIDKEGSGGNEESEENSDVLNDSSSPAPKEQSPSTSTTLAKKEETRTQPTLNADDISEENLNVGGNKNKEENEFVANNDDSNSDDSLFSISPGSSSSSAPTDNAAENNNDQGVKPSSPAPKQSSEQPKNNKVSYEECVALGNSDCGTPPDDQDDDEDKPRPKVEAPKPSDKEKSNKVANDSNQIDANDKSGELQEQKTKFWYDELPLKLGLPFVLLLFVLFVIIFLLFLVFLIQDSFSRRSEARQNNETIKIKTGHGTQKFNMNQLQMLEKRMRAAREDVDLHEVNVQSLNDKKDDPNYDQNNNVPNEFENIALQDKSSVRM